MPNKANRPTKNLSQKRDSPKPKRIRPEDSSDNDPDSKASKPHHNPTSSNSQSSSKKDDSKYQLRHDSNITN